MPICSYLKPTTGVICSKACRGELCAEHNQYKHKHVQKCTAEGCESFTFSKYGMCSKHNRVKAMKASRIRFRAKILDYDAKVNTIEELRLQIEELKKQTAD